MTDLRQNSMTGEQWVFEERSADPASTEEGERWLRTDLNSGDKIATLRVDVGSSIRDVPIFATGTAVDTVSEAMRIQVNGVTGYVPIAPVSDAAFPELRIQHNSQVHGFHNRVDPGPAIPDSAVQHLAFEQDYTDSLGTQNASAIGSPGFTVDAAAGSYAVDLSQSGDGVDTNLQNISDGQPFSVSFVFKEETSGAVGNGDYYFGAAEFTNFNGIQLREQDGLELLVNDGTNNQNISSSFDIATTSFDAVTFTFDGSDTWSLYANQLAPETMTLSTGSFDIGFNFVLGGRNGAGTFEKNARGIYDQYKRYDKELTAEEVSSLHSTGSI